MAEQEQRKMRPLYVAKFLSKRADDRMAVTATEIMDYLYDEHEMLVDRKTIYRDIAMLREQFGMDIQRLGDSKGYYLMSRQFEMDDLKILAECVYSMRFISKERTEDLIDVLCEFCSEYQAKSLKREVLSTERVKTKQNDTLRNINKIREAMHPDSAVRYCARKISFKYLTHTIDNIYLLVEKHGGKVYKVSPYKLVINKGDYYLLAYNDEAQEIRTYRIDRMSNVTVLEEPVDGRSDYYKLHIRNYLQSSFSMFSGECTKVTMRFENDLLDTVLDKFGTAAVYKKDDEKHFSVTADVNVSNQFFGWICGFGTKATILLPIKIQKAFLEFLSNIYDTYGKEG